MAHPPYEIPFHQERTSRLIPWVMGVMIYFILLLLMGFYLLRLIPHETAMARLNLNTEMWGWLLVMIGLMTFAALSMILLVFHTSLMVHAPTIDMLLWMGASEKFINSLFQKQARVLILKGTLVALLFIGLTLIVAHYSHLFFSSSLLVSLGKLGWLLGGVSIGLSFLTLLCGRALIATTISQRLSL